MLESPTQIETSKAPEPLSFDYEAELVEFLDEKERNLIGKEKIKEIENKTKEEKVDLESGGQEVKYDKHNKKITVSGVETSLGEIIASRHFETQIKLPDENDKEAGVLKQIRKKYFTFSRRDSFTKKLNGELAKQLAETEKHHVSKRDAYLSLSQREEGENKQEGAIAEKMMLGAIEMISIDRPDLAIEVRGANAYQDVEEKIDFIITTKKKIRNIGIEEKESKEFDEKSFGIQFTINTSKESFKKEQIERAKARGLDVDDLLYIAIDKELVHTALVDWEKKGKPISGPWGQLNKIVKTKALENIFKNILTEEQIQGILKGI